MRRDAGKGRRGESGGRSAGARVRDPRRISPAIEEALSGATLVECVERRGRRPQEAAFAVESIDSPPVGFDCEALLAESERVAAGLVGLGIERGERVLLVLPTSADFVFGFFGILRAGGTPVPAYPPAGMRQLAGFWQTLRRMVTAVGARFVIVPELLREVLTGGAVEFLGRASVITPEEIRAAADGPATLPPPPGSGDLALVQFSSGSTGDPRGVCLTHANVLSNIRAFLARIRSQPDDVCVSWLPLYHDMGLIGTLLGTLASGMRLVLLPPTDFLRRPQLWLELMDRHRATISVAPQFAFNLCVRKVDPESLAGVDLSPVRVILNGAEPIQADGVRLFEKRFAPLGLRPRVVTPCYGLAEVSLAAAMQPPRARWRSRPVPGGASVRAASGRQAPTTAVSVGPALDNVEIRIRGPHGGWLPDDRVGEICLRAPSVCVGHLSDRGLVPATDTKGWLHSGDLGFVFGGELFVTGRLKDLIIVGGRNLYPHDLESEAARISGFRPGRVVAFGVTEPERATEALVIVAESDEVAPANAAAAVTRLRQQLLQRFGVVPYDTLLVKRGQIPLTTSGKLRRSQARLQYEQGQFRDAVYRVRAQTP